MIAPAQKEPDLAIAGLALIVIFGLLIWHDNQDIGSAHRSGSSAVVLVLHWPGPGRQVMVKVIHSRQIPVMSRLLLSKGSVPRNGEYLHITNPCGSFVRLY